MLDQSAKKMDFGFMDWQNIVKVFIKRTVTNQQHHGGLGRQRMCFV